MSAARFDPIPLYPSTASRRFAREQAAREALRDALAAVWSGADFTDTDAVIDQLDDRGYLVVRK